MATRINVLTDHTINQIAAGEVIENPASVVKELVENSLDAGATDITIEIKGGGRQLIRISDNGCGMSYDDALLSLERHATSKIQQVEDLHHISSMGFRGEAVPSIAAISKFSILTCTEAQPDEATLVIVDGGRILKACSAARSRGTTIEVKSLFFNVPARKKFQKSPNQDSLSIQKLVNGMALSRPNVKFTLIGNQETLLHCPLVKEESFLDQLAERIRLTQGKAFFHALRPISAKGEWGELTGFIGAPSFTRPNRTGQWLFVNHRSIQAPLISFGVVEGYGTRLAPRRHPVFVLHLSLAGELLDINVHPQKKEVRFQKQYELKQAIIHAVNEALRPKESIRSSLPSQEQNLEPKVNSLPPPVMPPPSLPPKEDGHLELREAPGPTYCASHPQMELELSQPLHEGFTAPPVMGTMGSYILFDSRHADEILRREMGNIGEGLGLIDQHRAHARVLFEEMENRSAAGEECLEFQQLLFPVQMELGPEQSRLAIQNLTLLKQIGLHVREFGPQSFIIDAVAPYVLEKTVETLFVDTLCQLEKTRNLSPLDQLRAFALTASRQAIPRQKRLNVIESQALLNQWARCRQAFQCPLGQPVLASISSEKLTQLFNQHQRDLCHA